MAVNGKGIPARRFEPGNLIHRIGDIHRPVNGDVVVIVNNDHFIELEMAGKGHRLLADTFHQVAIAAQHIGIMVAQVAELRVHHPLGQRHAHGCGNALPQRAGGGFDTQSVVIFRMTGRFRAQFAEVLDVLDGHALGAGQIEQRIKQHGAMTARQHETVAVEPVGMVRIEIQHVPIENSGNIRRAQRQPGMAGFGFCHRIHGQSADGICHVIM